jgi:hypothetical protein
MIKHTFLSYSFLLSSSLLLGCGGSGTSDVTEELETTEPTTISSLVINEIVANAADGGNDWIELYALEGSIDLSSYSIVDDNEEHIPQALPSVTLAEGEFIVIQAIDNEDTPPAYGYYVTFKLGSEDAVRLLNNDVQIDELDWEDGDAAEGFSYGLFIDGSGTAQTLSPTAGEVNKETSTEAPVILDVILNDTAPLRINEIVANESAGGYDWIELYVTGSASVELGDYTIADENNELLALPDVTITSGEFYRIYATTHYVADLETVSFKLGNSDKVSLFLGDDLVDKLEWSKGQALIGQSYGRFPDGSDGTHTLEPSPMASNSEATHGPLLINEIVASDINEGNDWFELYNNSSENISLANYKVIDESDDIEPVTLPDVELAPNEYIVIYATDEDPGNYYVPFKLGKTDELSLILNDETVDYIDWDDSDVTGGFSYGLTVDEVASEVSWDKDFLTPTKGSQNELATAFNRNIVHDLSINITTENWLDILANPLDKEYHETSITFDGVTLDSVRAGSRI